MGKIKEILEKYNALNLSMSLEEERAMLYRYVYSTNRLEGNKLTLAQTSQLLSTDTVSGNNIRTKDILEQKGMYKALIRMLLAVRNKEKLSSQLLLELNWLTIGSLWKSDDVYLDPKQKGQQPGHYKISNNVIQITQVGKIIESIIPLSNPDNVSENMEILVDKVLNSTSDVVQRASFMAQELWLHQPYVDGNKRTGRLAINFLTMKEGFPLFSFDTDQKNYNSLLVKQYLENKPGLIANYINHALINKMNQSLNLKPSKGKNRGYRMVL